jgi:hypothetical protein
MTRHYRFRPFFITLERGITLLALPSMLVLGGSAANAEEIYGGAPIKKCADGTVVFQAGTAGPFNPNTPSAEPCDGHGGAVALSDPAHAIPFDASVTTLVCHDEAVKTSPEKKLSVKKATTLTKTSLEAEQETSTKGATGKGIDPHFTQSCDTVTMCADGQPKCSVDDLVTFTIGFPEIEGGDVTFDTIGVAHNILLDDMVSRARAFKAAGGALDDVVLTNIFRAVTKELYPQQSKASMANVPDLEEVRARIAMPLAENFKLLCQSNGKSAPSPTCSGGFVDLMITYGEMLDDLDDHDFDGARALISDLREDAEITLLGSERDAARIFANVYDASMTYWQAQDFDVTLRATDADAYGTWWYGFMHMDGPIYEGNLAADAASFGALYSAVVAVSKFF